VRLVRKLVVGLMVSLLFLVAAMTFLLWRSIPPLGGEAAVAGLEAEVEVRFDSLGIPHIRARSDADAFRALGYLHARDRLWQLEILRHAAQGRLAEMLGPAAVPSDRFLRSLDLPHLAQGSLALTSPESRALLDAYVAGLNAAIANPPRGLAPELRILRHRPEPWTAQHTAEIARLQGWDLASGRGELDRARARAIVGAERIRDLFPTVPESGAVILPPGAGFWSGRSGPGAGGRSRERTRRDTPPPVLLAREAVPEVPPLAERILAGTTWSRASNSWVIGSARSRSGRPILANDPHLELRAPALWYLAALESPGFSVVGGTIPGLPGIVIGRNRRIAWGFTNVELDDVDYVVERLSRDSSRVLTADGWQPVEVVRDSIRVRGRPAVPFTLRRTPHGPLVAARSEIAGAAPDSEVRAVAMRWTGQEPSDELTAILELNRAGDWSAFLAALARWKAPEQNAIYADVDGNIGYATIGRVPVRRSGRGLLPTAGWTEEGRWERFLDFDELPKAFNPPEGFIVTANNRIVGPEYPHAIEAEFAQPHRAARIRELILAGAAHTPADVARMQMDTLDLFARSTRELAAQAADAAGRPELGARLRAWDGVMGADRTEPTLFYLWYRALQRLTFEDEVQPGYAPGGPLQAWLRGGASPWFDDARTPEREDLAALSLRAMRDVLPEAERRWGAVHQTVGEHVLGDVPVLARLLRLNVGPSPRGGSLYTVNVADFGSRPPFVNAHAASLRQVVDLADPESGGLIITTGQAGHPLSRHYRDQVAAWWDGRLAPVPLSGDRVRARAVLRLKPQHERDR